MPNRPSNVPRKVSATGYTDPGKPDVWLKPGRLYVPRTVQATVEPQDWAGGARLEIWFEVDDEGKPSCREVRVQAAEGRAVSGQILKDVTLSRIMAAAMVDATWQHDPETGQVGAADPTEVEGRYPESVNRSTRGRRRSDEFLKRIVKLYRQAIKEGRPPRPFIQREEMVMAPSTVRRWLADAERRGFLSPSERLTSADGGRLRTKGATPE